MRRVAAELTAGQPTDDALEALRLRCFSPAIDAIVAASLVQRRSGGQLGSLLRRLARSFEDQQRLGDEVRVATAQARFTGLLVVGLPLGGGALAEMASPGLAAGLVDSALTAWLVGVALVPADRRGRPDQEAGTRAGVIVEALAFGAAAAAAGAVAAIRPRRRPRETRPFAILGGAGRPPSAARGGRDRPTSSAGSRRPGARPGSARGTCSPPRRAPRSRAPALGLMCGAVLPGRLALVAAALAPALGSSRPTSGSRAAGASASPRSGATCPRCSTCSAWPSRRGCRCRRRSPRWRAARARRSPAPGEGSRLRSRSACRSPTRSRRTGAS